MRDQSPRHHTVNAFQFLFFFGADCANEHNTFRNFGKHGYRVENEKRNIFLFFIIIVFGQ